MASMVIGHPENVSLNMMIDERKHTRDLAARRIKVERETDYNLFDLNGLFYVLYSNIVLLVSH
jgi:hypothetical protein